jgi:1-acyl-sn-glycerol-3-phosphate acyltransferase
MCVDLLGSIRAVVRIVCLILWYIGCWIVSFGASLIGLFSKPLGAQWRRKLSKTWVTGSLRLFGMRVVVKGIPPKSPYFAVLNHITWGDYFVVNTVLDARTILEAEDAWIPIVSRLMNGLDPIRVRRVREDVPRVSALMVEAIEQGDSLVMAPEGVVGPGKVVRRFHAALLEPAIQTGRTVHFFSITCRTPDGYPPASKVALFGPDILFRDAEGRIPQSELDVWGPPRSFPWFVFRLLMLPWHEFTVRFAPEPMTAPDRFTLARKLQEAVQAIFTPVK